MRWLVLIPLVAGCAATTQYAKWPLRGPMLEVSNPTARARTIFVRDGQGRELFKTTLRPERSTCFRWPFIHDVGYLLAVGSDTLSSGRFEPWTADGWAWDVGAAPVADPKVCR